MTATSPERAPPQVLLRPYREDDVGAIYDAVRESMASIGRWQTWCHAGYSLADARAWVLWQVDAFAAGTDHEFVVTDAEGALLGACGLNAIDRAHRRANLGYWVRAAAQGRGVATAAVRRLAAWAFAHTDLVRLEIVAAVGNVASRRVAEKAGAAREGVARSRLLVHGVVHDAVIYSLVREPQGTGGGGSGSRP